MKLIDEIKKAFKKRESKVINVRGEITGGKWAEFTMTNLLGEPNWDGTPIENLKISLQILNYDGNKFSTGDYRIDNHHNQSLHEHRNGIKFQIQDKVASHALARVLGNDCWVLNSEAIDIRAVEKK